MIAEQNLYSALNGSTLITAQTSSRIYPVLLPQEVTYPCICYQKISGRPMNHLTGYYGTANAIIQIDAWAKTYSEAKTLARDIRITLDASTYFEALLLTDRDLYDNTFEIFRVSADYSIWGAE